MRSFQFAVRSFVVFFAITSIGAVDIQASPNQAPTAVAGPDQTVGCAGPTTPNIVLNGSGSSDPEGQTLSYEWKDSSGTILSTAAVVSLTRKIGAYTFTLKVVDTQGASSTDSVTVTVQAECAGTTVTVDQPVSVDFNTNPPTCSDGSTLDLCQYFTYHNPANEPVSQWKATFDLGPKQLVVLTGVTIQATKVPATGDFRQTPGIEIRSKCHVTVQTGAVISLASANGNSGNIQLQADGGLVL